MGTFTKCLCTRFQILYLVDDFTKYCWFFPLKYKSEAFSSFIHFKSMVENILCTKIVTSRFDSGGEFINIQFSTFLRDHGIIHQLSCLYTPEQNGCVERKHRHLVETARTLLAPSKVLYEFWVDAFLGNLFFTKLQITTLSRSLAASVSHSSSHIQTPNLIPRINHVFFWDTVYNTKATSVCPL